MHAEYSAPVAPAETMMFRSGSTLMALYFFSLAAMASLSSGRPSYLV